MGVVHSGASLVPTLTRHVTLPYTQEALYTLVNDTESYPHFVPYCTGGQVISVHPWGKVAQLSFGCLGYHLDIKTRNTLHKPSEISFSLIEGPCASLEGHWQFLEHPEGSEIIFRLEYGLMNAWTLPGMEFILKSVTEHFYDAFIKEAHRRYADS